MLERDGYPSGVPCWVDTGQPDPEAAVGFYGDLFGWEFGDRMPAGAPGRYFVAQLRGRDVAAIGSQQDEAPATPMWSTYIWVDSADDAAAKIKAAGGSALSEPFDVLDVGRMGVCCDPSGAVFCLWQANGHKGAQLVNEPGTWNWSDLNTRDLAGAKDQGAPSGFEDAIAWILPMTSDQFPDDVPPHWSVTFAVDDTDAIAGRAAELGGTVIVPPVDAGVVRTAVLRDPQGAVFSVNKFEPR